MKKLYYSLSDNKIKQLLDVDDRITRLINYIDEASIELEEDGFKCIVKYIIGQQISDKARETIWKRIDLNIEVSAEGISQASEELLREYGLSLRKINYIKGVARAIISNHIDFKEFNNLSNDEVIKKLTALKGIGKWTAEMYLIFSLGRENVLSTGDRYNKKDYTMDI
jgi:hhH-GPD family protein